MTNKILFVLLLCGFASYGATIKGVVTDITGETLVGSSVIIKEVNNAYSVAGLDGSYSIANLKPGTYTITASFIGYRSISRQATISNASDVVTVLFELEADLTQLGEVTITAKAAGGSDMEARMIERTSPNTLNVISAKAIALSPDISVANVIQRVSGLSVERNSNGDPQYAIVRGMDKRYSYTLVNGVKIPSPDNKNRYVPLDIFPASLLERLEVYKSLSADMEGDAIGGGVNMVMKSAPESFEVKGDLQLGYNYINSLYGFDRYKSAGISKQSPRDMYGDGYLAQPGDFTKQNLEVKNIKPLPDMMGSFSIGNRFVHNKLGVMLGGSFQNAYRGTKSLWFDYGTDRFGSNRPTLGSVQDRHYSTQQMRGAAHARLDYKINNSHDLKFYTGYYRLINNEAREIKETYLDGRAFSSAQGDAILQYSTRTKTTDQGIITASLQGNHKLVAPLTLSWSGVYSTASNNQPDNARFIRNSKLEDFQETPQNVERNNPRQWTNNTDTDLTGYLNLIFQPEAWGSSLLKAGGMIRQKNRDSYYDNYMFDPNPNLQVQGVDWNTYSDVVWKVINPIGTSSNALNYKAHENINAFYFLGKLDVEKIELNAGIRVENTDQGYQLKNALAGQTPDSTQTYTDVLPGVSAKYKIRQGMNVRFTYYKGISRPGFFEIVPYRIPDDGYPEYGNPLLRRVKAHNIDLRWEIFPNATNQVLIGAFYKHILDPIEYVVDSAGITNDNVLQPNNFGTARNMGIEADITRYFNKFGIRANYTYTHSSITTSKALRTRVDPNDPSSELVLKSASQTRSLQGQAKHIGNLSLLYKDLDKGWESQLSLVYTGERLEAISLFLDNDIYAKPIVILDFALEKKVSNTIEVFIKASNLLNASYQMYVKKPVYNDPNKLQDYPHQDDPEHKTLVRKDQYYQSLRAGVRMQWNRN